MKELPVQNLQEIWQWSRAACNENFQVPHFLDVNVWPDEWNRSGLGCRLGKGPSKAGTDNTFGDAQLDVDLAADKIIFDELRVSLGRPVVVISSQ